MDFGGSFTTILNDAVPIFPALSVALQVTFVLPIGNVEPEVGIQVVCKSPSILS